MARPRKTYEELKASGAHAGRLAARKAQELAAQGIAAVAEEKAALTRGLSLATFLGRVKKERETSARDLIQTRQSERPLGIQYGMTVCDLVSKLGITAPEAQRLIDGMHRAYRTYFIGLMTSYRLRKL